MKRIVLLILFLSVGSIHAQQHHIYSQYITNRFALNPAVAGIKSCNNLSFGSRRQWVGFEGAPNIYFASFRTRINKSERFPRNIHGFGIYLANEQEGIQKSTYVKIAYAYHLKLWRNLSASAGIFVGIQQRKLGKVSLNTTSGQIDPAFEQNGPDYVYPEISPGIFIYNKKIFAGLSVFQAFPARFKEIGDGRTNLDPHIFIMAGYNFRTSLFILRPSFLFAAAPLLSPSVDFTFTANYRNRISIGIGAKYVNSAYSTLQVQAFSWLKVGYTYEYALSQIKKVAPSTNELVITITGCETEFINRPKFYCPAYE